MGFGLDTVSPQIQQIKQAANKEPAWRRFIMPQGLKPFGIS